MLTEEEHLASLPELLTQQILDFEAYFKSVRGKELKRDFKKLTSKMAEGDELWEWEWWAPRGPRNSYSMGWCIVRQGLAVASHCHSHS